MAANKIMTRLFVQFRFNAPALQRKSFRRRRRAAENGLRPGWSALRTEIFQDEIRSCHRSRHGKIASTQGPEKPPGVRGGWVRRMG
jgi:hypothetical protein